MKPLKSMWVLMALLLLNCSVDTSVIFTSSQKFKNVSYNFQESIIEIVVEQFLGFENAIPESKDNDKEQQSNIKKVQLIDIFIIPDLAMTKNSFASLTKKSPSVEINTHFSKFFFKIPSPPPEI